MDDGELTGLAGQARRYLHWAVFLLLMMFAIMIIDLQLKKAIAGQARVAGRLYTDLVVRYGGPASHPPADHGAGGDGDSSVGGDARLAAADGDSPHAAAAAEAGGVDGAQDRAPGDGRRTPRPRGGG